MHRRGLEPPPTECGPGPHPGNSGVISLLCVHIVQNVQNVRGSGRIGRNGRSGCCRGCCHGLACPRARSGASAFAQRGTPRRGQFGCLSLVEARVAAPRRDSRFSSVSSLSRAWTRTPACTVKRAAPSQPSTLPQHWIRVKVVPQRPGSASSDSASRRSEASSSSLSVLSRRDSSATLN